MSVVAATLLAAACAAPQPMVVSAPSGGRGAGAPSASPVGRCIVIAREIRDQRRDRQTLGMVTGRAVKAPSDVDGWLRSTMEGLGGRGLDLRPAADAAPAEAIEIHVDLQAAWLRDIKTSKAANVLVHVRAERGGAPLLDRDYRGNISRINWASTDAELQHLIDDAFGKALDAIAADLKTACAT